MSRATLFLAARANLAPATLRFYSRFIDEYTRFHGNSEQISTVRLSQFLAAQKCRGNGIHAKLRALKAWANFLIEQGKIEPIRFPKIKRREPYQPCPKPGEVLAFLNSVEKTRDQALLILAVDCGLRRSELAQLCWRGVDLGEGRLVVRGPKNGKDRIAFIGPRTAHALRAWQAEARNTETVFGLQVPGVQSVMRRLRRQTGSRITPHSLRRFFATSCTRSGMGIDELRRLLGHSSEEMTRSYIKTIDDDLREAHRPHSPAEHLAASGKGLFGGPVQIGDE